MVLPNGCSLTRELGITWSRMPAFDQSFLEVYMQQLIRYFRCLGWLSQFTGFLTDMQTRKPACKMVSSSRAEMLEVIPLCWLEMLISIHPVMQEYIPE